jgi:recombinational DNA repair ATPase RecF
VIKLETAHIEEMRGIRKLDIDFQKQRFAISGPNGSGKSGVIDAIEFGLTGQIGRLTGRGTKNLTLAEHGPHVDKLKFPDAAFVTLRVFLTDMGKSVTITRKVSSPKKPTVIPDDDEVKAVLAEIADHPEITLSRREILRFILVEPTTRSEEIQSLLKLDELGQTRSVLFTAQNKLHGANTAATSQVQNQQEALLRHLQTATLRKEDVLAAVNQRRMILNLPALLDLTADSEVDTGLAISARGLGFNKQSAQRDLEVFAKAIESVEDVGKVETAEILGALSQLAADPALFTSLQQRPLVEKGIELVQGRECPLCDTPWTDEEHLRNHLKTKLEKSEAARKLRQSLSGNGAAMAREATRLSTLIAVVQRIAELQADPPLEQTLASWKTYLEAFKAKLLTVEGIFEVRRRLGPSWLSMPVSLPGDVKRLAERVNAIADQTVSLDAQTYLTTAQLRLRDWREARRKASAAEITFKSAKAAYEIYCTVLEDELNLLYEEVQADFSAYYRTINGEDEQKFTAKLTPSEGKLEFDVNFYDRGLYPPGAYHSEGHQDGMGVCLYLALMKRLLGKRFTFALLDDVVMSVDAGHRYEFCKLLKTHFPDTQFVITTHDRVWAEQMKSAGLVSAKTSLAIHSWTIDTGPLVESGNGIWHEIAAALTRGKVENAAMALRHHLEYFARMLADQVGATPQFRSDGNYELGDLLPSVLSRMRELCGKAASAAQSWGDQIARDAASERKAHLSDSNAAINVEQWAVNKAVHYNAWANFSKHDFEPVVSAFKELLECFQCVQCESWVYVTPRKNPESLRCSCNAINLNLKAKPR